MLHKRVEVRLVDAHPAASRKEVARFKAVRREEAIKLLAAAQVILHGTSSLWRYELRTPDGWKKFGPKSVEQVRSQVNWYYVHIYPLAEIGETHD